MPLQEALAGFERHFGNPPDYVVRAPGRVNLIGDHTDYTGGLVLPIAIDRALLVAARATDEPVVAVYSAHFDQGVRIALGALKVDPDQPWSRYVAGVIALLAGCIPKKVAGADRVAWASGSLPVQTALTGKQVCPCHPNWDAPQAVVEKLSAFSHGRAANFPGADHNTRGRADGGGVGDLSK